jgi:xylulokinase
MLGIDVGTNACKTIVVNAEGRSIARASREYPVLYPQATWAEQDADLWWNAVSANVREVLRKIENRSGRVAGIGVDSQREAVVYLDGHGRKLANSLIWMDQRTIPQAEKMKKLISSRETIERAGVPIDYFYSASKIKWLQEKRPSIFKKTRSLLFPKDYIVYRLTGCRATDHSMASRTMLFDIRKRRWSEEICDKIGIPISLLPPSIEASDVVGEITSEAAASTGLRAGIPVVSGGGDRPCEAIGAGVAEPGLFNIGTGSATVITTPLTKPKVDREGRIDCCCHVVPNMWEYEIAVSTTGASLRWFRDNFGYEEIRKSARTGLDTYVYFDALAQKVKPGSNGLMYFPYLMGAKAPKFNSRAKAVFFGLTISHTKAHLIRAILEGVAFQYVESTELLKGFGLTVNEASIVGGEARSNLWNQIKADVLGRPIKRPAIEDAAALGAAILASVGIGKHSTIGKAVKNMVTVERTYRPRINIRRTYTVLWERYSQVYKDIERAYNAST